MHYLHSKNNYSVLPSSVLLLNIKWKNHFHEINGDVGMAGWK